MKIDTQETWSLELAEDEGSGALGHYLLLPRHVAGSWFAVDRETGRRLWSGVHAPPNGLLAATDDTLIGTEVRHHLQHQLKHLDRFGIYGLDLNSGAYLWRDDRSSPLHRLRHACERFFGLPTNHRDEPLAVSKGKVFTRRKRVLDGRTGEVLPPESAPAAEEPSRNGRDDPETRSRELLFQSVLPLDGSGIRLLRQFNPEDPLDHLTIRDCSRPPPGPGNLGAVDGSGALLWEHRPSAEEPGGLSRLAAFRIVGDHMILVDHLRPESGEKTVGLRVLDLQSGGTVQCFPLPVNSEAAATIEAADGRGILIGLAPDGPEGPSMLIHYGYQR